MQYDFLKYLLDSDYDYTGNYDYMALYGYSNYICPIIHDKAGQMES